MTSAPTGIPGAPAKPAPTYRLSHDPDGTSWTARENLTDILSRELLGPRDGETEVLQDLPDALYLLGRIAPRKLQASGVDPRNADADDEAAAFSDLGDADDARASSGVPLTSVEDSGAAADEDAGGGEDEPAKRGLMIPALMGLRFQVPLGLRAFTVTASWGFYDPFDSGEKTATGRAIRYFRRTPVTRDVTVTLAELHTGVTLEKNLLHDEVKLRLDRHDDPTRGCAIVEVALCNDRIAPRSIPTSDWLFQTALSVTNTDEPDTAVFLPVNDPLEDSWREDEPELRMLQMQYRHHLEFAIGRTCSADWTVASGARRATSVRTTWLPVVETPQVQAVAIDALLDMTTLATASPSELDAGLRPLITAYDAWLSTQADDADTLPEHLREAAGDAVITARQVHRQLSDGLDYLIDPAHPEALRCFRFMNHVMAQQRIATQVAELRATDATLSIEAARTRVLTPAPGTDPARHTPHHWRAFQLAFILMQIPALCEPANRRRSGDNAKAQLLFFPTGGGKTEAYLGLAAFTLAIRRRDGLLTTPTGALDGRAGVGVLMRYTLRLLTAQQFQRATALVCAAELVRRDAPATWGDTPFRIGLWVGTEVSPKRVKEAAEQLRRVNEGRGFRLTALQFKRCPWCGTPITSAQVQHEPTLERIYVYCANTRGGCPFAIGSSGARGTDEGLPVLTVDEEIYRLAPSFVIATVDKFARLAREGEAASLFGHVHRLCQRHGYAHPDTVTCRVDKHNAKDAHPAATIRPTPRLRPPDLIIQDELHLITGALGTTVGLFEVAVDTLCGWTTPDGQEVKPLMVASSATVRNAFDQVKNLYGRNLTIFPPQVLEASKTFFSQPIPVTRHTPGRRYVGLSTTGVRLTKAEIRISEVLLSAGQLLLNREPAHPAGADAPSPVDPYLTLVGYFSSVRELAGMARYLVDDVQEALRKGRPWTGLPKRFGTQFGALRFDELTGRVSNADITATLDEMAVPFTGYDTSAAYAGRIQAQQHGTPVPKREPSPYDTILATSMLQVGVDVPRLGLMMVVGQPKNTAEYIQASSRVGRSASMPGLVVSVGNWARPRDLAHFEQFRHYHETFYAQVEPLSVTPFSPTSLDRGLDGVLISLARVLQAELGPGGLSPEQGASRIDDQAAFVDHLVEMILDRILRASSEDARDHARQRLLNRVDAWRLRRTTLLQENKTLVYERAHRSSDGPLITAAENAASPSGNDRQAPLVVANSMREVQPEINLLVTPNPDKLLFKHPPGSPTWVMPTPEDDH